MKNLQEFLNSKGENLKVDGVVGRFTLDALDRYIQAECIKRKWYTHGNGLVWIRTDNIFSNKFDDFVAVYKGHRIVYAAPASTTAGDFYVYNPLTVGGITGTAVAVEQQVQNSHKFVSGANWANLWLGAPYFQQVAPIEIYRDGNKNNQVDKVIKQKGLFGINFHRAGVGNLVNKWSAGCQTVPDAYWFEIVKRFNPGDVIAFTLFCTSG
jgi:hypothetical protein